MLFWVCFPPLITLIREERHVKQRLTLAKDQKPHDSYIGFWFFFSIVIFMFGGAVNQGTFLGYPLAYYMSAQGSLAAFVVLIFWFANKQEKIDDEHGYGGEREDD